MRWQAITEGGEMVNIEDDGVPFDHGDELLLAVHPVARPGDELLDRELRAMIVCCLGCGTPVPVARVQILNSRYCLGCAPAPYTRDPNVLCARASAAGRNGFAAND